MTSNLQGQTSFQTASSGAANGSTLTVTSAPLTIAANTAFAAPTYIAGTQNARIASFVISAATAQGAKVSSLTFDKDSNASFDIQNLKVMIGSTQFGSTRASIGDAETSLSFSGATPASVPSGGSIVVDVYGDILQTTTSATHSAVIDVTGWSALGTISNSAITFPGAVSGQSIVVSAGPTLTVAKGSASAPTAQVVMGSTGNSIFTVRLTNDNVDDVRVTDMTFTDTITSGSTGIASFKNLTLWQGTTQVSGPLAMTMPGSATATVAFHLSPTITVSKNSSTDLTVKGDIATFTSGGATSGSAHVFGVAATTDVTSTAVNNGTATITVSGTPSGNTLTIYRTKLSLAAATSGATSGRPRVANDDIATITFSANAAYQVLLGTVTLKFQGLAISSGSTAFNVDLIDTNTNITLGETSADVQSCNPASGNSCSVTFTPVFTISGASSVTAKVRVVSSSFFNSTVAGGESLSAFINAATDVAWNDGTTAGIGLEGTIIPFTITNVSYE